VHPENKALKNKMRENLLSWLYLVLLMSLAFCLRTSNGSSVGEFDNMQNTPSI